MTENGKELVVTYQSTDGENINLDVATVKQYLVRGRANYVSDQEFMFFCQLCKARKLNPFINDCYLVKYTQNDPAAIILSIHYKRALARMQPDYRGHRKGIIVETRDGKVKDSHGLLRKEETLLGGWFEAKPEGYTDPFRLEVNLGDYIKKTRDGEITQFWQPAKQCTMIAKVAESQGLSTLWPKDLGHLYTEEEIQLKKANDVIDIEGEEHESEIPLMTQGQLDEFLELLPGEEDQLLFRDYLFERGSIETNEEGQPILSTMMEPVAGDLLQRWDDVEQELGAFAKKQAKKIDPETYQAFRQDLLDAGYSLMERPEEGSKAAEDLKDKKEEVEALVKKHKLDGPKLKKWFNEVTKTFSGKIRENKFHKLSYAATPVEVLQQILDTVDEWLPYAIRAGLQKNTATKKNRKPPAA